MKVVFGIITAVAFVFLLGTAGSIDTGAISDSVGTARMIVSASIMVAAFIGVKKA